MKYAIGIDIGGTKISAALGTSAGKILVCREIKTRKRRQVSACLEELLLTVESLLKSSGVPKKKISGIGVCLPGAVDTRRAVVPVSPHLEGWYGIPLGKILSKRFRLPVRMANDANAAAVAEKIFGGGRGVANFIYITVSTGIGAGIVAEGKLLTGESYVAGEIGHMTVEPHGEKWKLNEIGVLEAYASGTAIAKFITDRVRGRSAACRKPFEDGWGNITARSVNGAALQGNRLALEAYERAGFYLGIGVANLLNSLNPGKIILGGGVVKSSPPVFWRTFRKTCRERSWKQAYRAVRIVRTRLGRHVGNLGALALVFEQI
jgi:glucokinase